MKRLFPLALIGLGLVIIVVTAGFWSFTQKAQHPSSAPLPEKVAGLSLTQSLTEEEAIEEFARLHGNDFPLTSGAVGMYGDDHAVTLWVAGASSQATAGKLVIAMRENIANSFGASPFTPTGERSVGSRSVYELDGMGQKHFYFQSGKLIVWLAANPGRAEESLSEILKFYP